MRNFRILYLASESFMVACNNIYWEYNGNKNIDLDEIKRTEEHLSEKIRTSTWGDDVKYLQSVKKIKNAINDRLKYLFCNAVFSQLGCFTPKQIRDTYNYQPCIIYGGGLGHPGIAKWGEICVFDSGVFGTLHADQNTLLSSKDIKLYLPDSSIIKNKNWEDYFYLLIVAFGLSNLHHKDHSYWDDHQYQSLKTEKILEEIPHPRNEGLYIYNVLARLWQ